MKRILIIALLFAVPLAAQVATPAKYLSGITIASNLPKAVNAKNQFWGVTDGASATDCTSGGGSTAVICESNGTSWTAVQSGGAPSGAAGGVLSGTYPNPGLSASATAIPSAWTATTQTPGDSSTKLATTAYVATPGPIAPTTMTASGAASATSFTATGTTAGFADFPQGTTSVAVAPCNTANSICEQAPTSVTAYLVVKPGTGANGTLTNNVAAAVDTQGFSGDTNHSATVTIGSGTSIGSTILCSTAICTVGTYRVNVYVDITTACGTTGTYVVNLIYTDDQGSKTIPVNIQGSGSVPLTGVLTTTSTANFGAEAQIIRSTGAASINYSTTAVACGTAGPMVGKLYLSVEPIQ